MEASTRKRFNVVVIGGGPAGLAAAINAASEGLTVLLIDAKEQMGGQASASSCVENYPGFPGGISGAELTAKFMQQASQFGVRFLRPAHARMLERQEDGVILVTTDDDTGHRRVEAQSVILASGLSYRKLESESVAAYVGRGVFYGVSPRELQGVGNRICIVGGANSAGQSALHLAAHGGEVFLIVRATTLEDGMSQYLIDRIRTEPKILVMTGAEVQEVGGSAWLERVTVTYKDGRLPSTFETNGVCLFIGARPKTFWLNGVVAQDRRGYILTGNTVRQEGTARELRPFETSMPGVFACGDVRDGSIKRIASAVGEGVVAVQQVRAFLAATNP